MKTLETMKKAMIMSVAKDSALQNLSRCINTKS